MATARGLLARSADRPNTPSDEFQRQWIPYHPTSSKPPLPNSSSVNREQPMMMIAESPLLAILLAIDLWPNPAYCPCMPLPHSSRSRMHCIRRLHSRPVTQARHQQQTSETNKQTKTSRSPVQKLATQHMQKIWQHRQKFQQQGTSAATMRAGSICAHLYVLMD